MTPLASLTLCHAAPLGGPSRPRSCEWEATPSLRLEMRPDGAVEARDASHQLLQIVPLGNVASYLPDQAELDRRFRAALAETPPAPPPLKPRGR